MLHGRIMQNKCKPRFGNPTLSLACRMTWSHANIKGSYRFPLGAPWLFLGWSPSTYLGHSLGTMFVPVIKLVARSPFHDLWLVTDVIPVRAVLLITSLSELYEPQHILPFTWCHSNSCSNCYSCLCLKAWTSELSQLKYSCSCSESLIISFGK